MSLRLPFATAAMAVAIVLGYAAAPRVALLLTAGVAFLTMVAWRPSQCVTILFALGALLIDFSPLSVYRYFLLSDLLLLTACLVQFWMDRRRAVYIPALLTMLWLGYLVASFATFGWAGNFIGLFNWLHFAFLILVYVPLMTTLFVRRPDLKVWLVSAIVVSALLQSLILFGQIANGLEWRTGTRISGALGTAGLWTYVAAVTALTTAAMSVTWSGRLWSVIGLSIIGLAEMFLKSRMLWLSSLLGAALTCSLYGGRKWQGLAFAALVCAVLSIGYAADFYPDAIQRRISDTLHPTETPDLVARLQVVQDLAGAIETSGGFGIGVGQSESYMLNQHSSSPVTSVHNILMHAAVEGGLLAFASLLLMPLAIGVLWRAAARTVSDPSRDFLLIWEVSTLVAIYVGAQLTPTLFEHTFYTVTAALAATVVEAGGTSRLLSRVLGTPPSPTRTVAVA